MELKKKKADTAASRRRKAEEAKARKRVLPSQEMA
jgi:hypothetical protein